MYFVYVLQGRKNGKLYTGFTKDLKTRYRKHKLGGVHTTKRMGEIDLIYYEAFKAESDARRREKYLKTSKGKRTLRVMLKESIAAIV